MSEFNRKNRIAQICLDVRLESLKSKQSELEQIVSNLKPDEPQGVRVKLMHVEGDIKATEAALDRRVGR